MSLARVDTPPALRIALDQWVHYPFSQIKDHGEECCSIAKAWLVALDRSKRSTESNLSAPTWVLERFPWGPSPWPIHWCEVAASEILDCGALADLTRMIIHARGVNCTAVQVILQFSADDVRHWAATWNNASQWAEWISGSFAYHEVCAVYIRDNTIRIWDPSDNTWIKPGKTGLYGTAVAIRLLSEGKENQRPITWENRHITPNQWQLL
jgi:hypothetical protein